MNLYNTLQELTNTNDSFYSVDYNNYVIFGYRLAKYTDWCNYGALQSRGIVFNKTTECCVCMPMNKFFNLNENPLSMLNNMEIKFPISINEYEKLDGSLISIFYDNGTIFIKSKMSFDSEQAKAATNIFNSYDDNLKAYITDICMQGYTINCEYISFLNQIVIKYPSTELIVLNIRNNTTGEYTDKFNDIFEDYNMLVKCDKLVFNTKQEISDYFDYVKSLKNIEGYVYIIGDTWIKIKTDDYNAKHRLMGDNLEQVKAKFSDILQLVLLENIDDYIASLEFKSELQEYIKGLTVSIIDTYNCVKKSVLNFHDTFGMLTKKEYAKAGLENLNKFEFPIAMQIYKMIHKEIYIKQYILNNPQKFKQTYNL